MKKHEPGFYWVEDNAVDDPYIAQYMQNYDGSGSWYRCGDEVPLDGRFTLKVISKKLSAPGNRSASR